jgi:hypothetical protein
MRGTGAKQRDNFTLRIACEEAKFKTRARWQDLPYLRHLIVGGFAKVVQS